MLKNDGREDYSHETEAEIGKCIGLHYTDHTNNKVSIVVLCELEYVRSLWVIFCKVCETHE